MYWKYLNQGINSADYDKEHARIRAYFVQKRETKIWVVSYITGFISSQWDSLVFLLGVAANSQIMLDEH